MTAYAGAASRVAVVDVEPVDVLRFERRVEARPPPGHPRELGIGLLRRHAGQPRARRHDGRRRAGRERIGELGAQPRQRDVGLQAAAVAAVPRGFDAAPLRRARILERRAAAGRRIDDDLVRRVDVEHRRIEAMPIADRDT